MEECNLGTKATRHTYIKLLQDRGYLKKIKPSQLGLAFISILDSNYKHLLSSELTAQLDILVKDYTIINHDKIILEHQEVLRGLINKVSQNDAFKKSLLTAGRMQRRVLKKLIRL